MPSAKVLEEKKVAVSNLTEDLKSAVAGVLVDYRGITVEQDTELRRKLREAGVEYKIVKNSLLRFASKEVGLDELDGVLHGPTAIAFHREDMVAPAKVLADYAKTNEVIEIKSGFMEGKVISLDEIKTLASTPSKDVLIAKIMGSLNAPVSALVRLLNTIVEGGTEIADLIAAKAGEAPAEEAKAEETPAEEAKAEETPAEETKAEETPAEEVKAEETPAEETTEE
ncbi:MAG: 50S ribosomal protein L10 [Clostridia bacterium]|nr:50S ribosomal protein L10 [Clostridia bacterium]